MTTLFDKRKEYEALVMEKVIELKRICHMEKIPMFITVCVENTANETIYEKEMVSAATCDYDLTDDQIAKHVNVSLGFDTLQPSVEDALNMDDMEFGYIEEEGDETTDEAE